MLDGRLMSLFFVLPHFPFFLSLSVHYFAPTVIRFNENSTLHDTTSFECSPMFCEETFGPVMGVYPFDSEEEAFHLANNTPAGLSGYLFSSSYGQIRRAVSAVEVGMLGVNDSAISSELIPFGGVKESGLGREGASEGLAEYQNIRYVCMGGLKEVMDL